MDYKRSDRVGDLLLEVVSQLLVKEVNDPRVAAVTLTGTDVSPDLRHAKIYFNLLTGAGGKAEAEKGLKSAAGFIRGRAGKELKLRLVPTIEFVYDDTEERARRIDELLDESKKDR
ncbi:MAG TPA: 30S ribosome-binding factor RbfA [Candidatus Binatia bacterium]